MVELVPLSNDSSLSFPLAEKNNADKRVNKWFNPMLPLWRRVRELQQQGYVLSAVHCGPEHTISLVVLTLPEAGVQRGGVSYVPHGGLPNIPLPYPLPHVPQPGSGSGGTSVPAGGRI